MKTEAKFNLMATINYIIGAEGNLKQRYIALATEATEADLVKAYDKVASSEAMSAGYIKKVKGYVSNLMKTSKDIRVECFNKVKERWDLEAIRRLATLAKNVQDFVDGKATKTASKFVEAHSIKDIEGYIKAGVNNISINKSPLWVESEPKNEGKSGLSKNEKDEIVENLEGIYKLEVLKALDDETFEATGQNALKALKAVIEAKDAETLRLVLAVLPQPEAQSK